MKRFNHGIKWTLAAVLLAGVTAAPVMAEKTTPATGKNSAVPAVPRAIPDLIPYHKFDPPKSKLFDMSKLTISGDMRVRPEFRNEQSVWDRNILKAASSQNNTLFRAAMGAAGLQLLDLTGRDLLLPRRNIPRTGASMSSNSLQGPADANALGADANGTLYARQAFMLVRNFLVPNLTVKAGRQLVVWGNHRMFGHFDWNNVGWSHDGMTANYKLSKTTSLQVGWLRTDETNCTTVNATAGGCAGGEPTADTDADVVYVRAPMKVAGIVLEPTYIWHSGGTGGNDIGNAPRPMDQSRHTLGGRAVKKFSAGSARVDATMEGYYQFGEIGTSDATGATSARTMDIEAYAFHFDGGHDPAGAHAASPERRGQHRVR